MLIIDRSKLFWLFLFITAGILTLNGILTDVHLGDESHHYHFAQNIYRAGKRVPFDPLYESGNPPGFFYNSPPLWHFGLAFVWKITGGISQAIAQVYHAIFLILLIGMTYLLAKEQAGEEAGWFSALIIATVPMVVSFSTLLYMDIPTAALSTLSFYFVLKRRYIGAGIAAGSACLIKFNAGFLLPGLSLFIFWNERKKIWSLLNAFSFFILPIFFIHLPDRLWRQRNINPHLNTVDMEQVIRRVVSTAQGESIKEYLSSYTTNPIDLVKYFGIAFGFCFILFLFSYRQWAKNNIVLWFPLVSYLLLLILFFGIATDIRYLLPIVPKLVVLVSPHVLRLRQKWKYLLIGICIVQFINTTYYVFDRRKMPQEVKEGLGYVKNNVPKDALILYPEENLLIYGERRIVWSSVSGKSNDGLSSFFWVSDIEEVGERLSANRISHILIKKSRIYDDQKERHLGGYPKSFVEKIPYLKGWEKVFENSEMALWKRHPSL
jgi:4-amino-4-deoxy-L-arabinose transferase-like glycosyltransferase